MGEVSSVPNETYLLRRRFEIMAWVFLCVLQAKDAGEKKADAGEKKVDAGEKKAEGPAPAVFKIDLHCEGCAKKVRRYVRKFDGKKSKFF